MFVHLVLEMGLELLGSLSTTEPCPQKYNMLVDIVSDMWLGTWLSRLGKRCPAELLAMAETMRFALFQCGSHLLLCVFQHLKCAT